MKISSWQIYKRLLGYLQPHLGFFFLSICGYILYALTQTGFAVLMEKIVAEMDAPSARAYLFLPLAILSITFARGLGGFVGTYCLDRVAFNVVYQLREQIFASILTLPRQQYLQQNSGHYLAILIYNVEQVTSACTSVVRTLVREGATVLGLVSYLFYLNWQLSLLFFASSPFIAIAISIASKRFRKLAKSMQSSIADITHAATESLQGNEVVKTFGGYESELARFNRASADFKRQSLKMTVTSALNSPVVQMMVSSALALLIFVALYPGLMTQMPGSEFVAFLITAGLIAKPLRALTEINGPLQRGITAANSLFEVIDAESELDNGEITVERAKGELVFKQVCFSYTDTPVLKNIDFTMSAGQTVALVGRSGSGKSTLANLIPRFFERNSGTITLDGVLLEDYQLHNLREQIAIVNQQVVLFSGTIKSNIAYGSLSDKTDSEVRSALETANAIEFVDKLPLGIHTPLGEKGLMLSGGQRQRLAIARAMLKDAPVLILDEATSSLDNHSERYIQQALERVMKNRTTLVIAHRLSTIKNADIILVMDNAEIVECGTHQQLLDKQGLYAELHQQGFDSDETKIDQ
ncbi:MAG: lipid A export permease/ATP-binding protein MsbA [Oceanospirillaceae bacterium]|nr:lipid A export permease/ATP-binding protein MsbA [Oceanospirillaceae bacterium]